MNNLTDQPSEIIASTIVAKMTHEKIIDVVRFLTGEQFFVYAVSTENQEYVLRIAQPHRKSKFLAGFHWQEKLIPLGIPLAKFINFDFDEHYSPFPALLMKRLPGDDLCNVYETLSSSDKRNLANAMVEIQAKKNALPDGPGYGILASYETPPEEKSWSVAIV